MIANAELLVVLPNIRIVVANIIAETATTDDF
jgi:hypothetical protein